MRKLVLLSLLMLSACAAHGDAQAPARQPSSGPARPNDTLAQIRALAGTPSCSDDSQCHTLALGARACGGPEGYLPWSSAHTAQAEIQALGERYKAERQAANAASGALSTCQFMPDPGAVCQAGTCQLRKATGPTAM